MKYRFIYSKKISAEVDANQSNVRSKRSKERHTNPCNCPNQRGREGERERESHSERKQMIESGCSIDDLSTLSKTPPTPGRLTYYIPFSFAQHHFPLFSPFPDNNDDKNDNNNNKIIKIKHPTFKATPCGGPYLTSGKSLIGLVLEPSLAY